MDCLVYLNNRRAKLNREIASTRKNIKRDFYKAGFSFAGTLTGVGMLALMDRDNSYLGAITTTASLISTIGTMRFLISAFKGIRENTRRGADLQENHGQIQYEIEELRKDFRWYQEGFDAFPITSLRKMYLGEIDPEEAHLLFIEGRRARERK